MQSLQINGHLFYDSSMFMAIFDYEFAMLLGVYNFTVGLIRPKLMIQ